MVKLTDTIELWAVLEGSWKSKRGKWIEFLHAENGRKGKIRYVFMTDMVNIERQADVQDSMAVAKREESRLAVKAETDQSNTSIRLVYLTSTIPIVLLILSTIYWLRKYYIKVAVFFNKICTHPQTGCLGALILMGPFILGLGVLGYRSSGGVLDNLIWLYRQFGLKYHGSRHLYAAEVGYGGIFHYEMVTVVLAMVSVFIIWIGIGCAVSVIVLWTTSGKPATAYGTSYDGGKTIHIDYISPAIEPSIDVNFGAVMNYYLIYSILYSAMYGLVYIVWPSDHNWFRPLFLGAVLTAVVSLWHRYRVKKKPEFGIWCKTYALSFLGFGCSIVVIFFVLFFGKLLVGALG